MMKSTTVQGTIPFEKTGWETSTLGWMRKVHIKTNRKPELHFCHKGHAKHRLYNGIPVSSLRVKGLDPTSSVPTFKTSTWAMGFQNTYLWKPMGPASETHKIIANIILCWYSHFSFYSPLLMTFSILSSHLFTFSYVIF